MHMVAVPQREMEKDSEREGDSGRARQQYWHLQRVQHLLLCRRVKPNEIYAAVASNGKDISDKEPEECKEREGKSERKSSRGSLKAWIVSISPANNNLYAKLATILCLSATFLSLVLGLVLVLFLADALEFSFIIFFSFFLARLMLRKIPIKKRSGIYIHIYLYIRIWRTYMKTIWFNFTHSACAQGWR